MNKYYKYENNTTTCVAVEINGSVYWGLNQEGNAFDFHDNTPWPYEDNVEISEREAIAFFHDLEWHMQICHKGLEIHKLLSSILYCQNIPNENRLEIKVIAEFVAELIKSGVGLYSNGMSYGR